MSLIVKIILPIAIAVAAIWGYLQYTGQAAPQYGAVPQQAQQAAAPEQNSAPVADESAQITARGTSDTSLDADMKAIDAQLQAAAESQASVDAGLSDQAGNTTY